MFRALVRRLKSSAGEVVENYLERAAVTALFLVAAGFLVAAVTVLIIRNLGPVTGCVIMAVFFGIAGALTAAVMFQDEEREAEKEQEEEALPAVLPALTGEDRELIMAAVRAAVPALVPAGGRMLVRNLPLLAAIAAGLFVLTRQDSPAAGGPGADGTGLPGRTPAE